MAKTINPALFIGLGGTGHKVLLQVKTALLRNYGEVPSATKLLCFDTDKRELSASFEEIEYQKKNEDGSRTKVKEKISFKPSETVGIPITNPLGLLKQEYIRDWVSENVQAQIGPSDTGAKQIRQMGRFAIFENFGKEKIANQIESRINELKNVKQLKGSDYEIIGEPAIHLVFSPAGGTGAGSFIDIVTIIRNIDPTISVWGYMVMPEFYTSFPMTTSVIQNSYASLMEIDHLMGQDATKDDNPNKNKWWSNYPKKPYTVDFNGNGNVRTLPGGSTGFFEYLYLFDNINEKGKYIDKVEDVYDRIGRILYLMVSGPGSKIRSSYSNNKDYTYPSSAQTNNKRRNYSSMGISQIVLDRDFLKRIKINQITQTIINTYCYSSDQVEVDSINTFIDENSWREDNGHDMLIDKLVAKNHLKYSTDILYPSKYKKGEWSTEIKNNVEGFLSSWDQKIKTLCESGKEQFNEDFKNKINSKLSFYLKDKGGINKGKQFLSFLIGAFNGMVDEMESESTVHKSKLDKFRKNIPDYLESITNEENAFNPIGKERRVREATEILVQHYEKMLVELWQETRKNTAKLIYNIWINLLKDLLDDLNNMEDLFIEASGEVERANQKILNSSTSEKDFERSIHHFYKDLMNENTSDINITDAFKSIDFSSGLKFKNVREIIEKVEGFARTTEAHKNIDALTVEKIISRLDKSTIKNIISYLDVSSSVCMDVDGSFLYSTEKADMEKFGFLCVGNAEDTIFSKGSEVHSLLSTEGGYGDQLKPITTGDPDKITLFKIAGMFPAAAIRRIQNYKIKFENSSMYHFSDVYFEKNALDLLEGPSDDEGEGLRWFTVGSALGKIKIERGALSLEMENGKKIPLYEGSRNKTNRAEAVKVFSKNKDLIAYIENHERLISEDIEKGKPYLAQKVREFYSKIESVDVLGKQFSNIDKESEEYHNIYAEKQALKDYAESYLKTTIAETVNNY